jgi:hypothetical protein
MIDQFRDEMIRFASKHERSKNGFALLSDVSIVKIRPLRNLLALTCCCLASCGGSSSQTMQLAHPTTSNIQTPTSINLYPVGYAVNPRIFVMVTPGTAPVTLPLAFDTGSSGITLNALNVFPPSMVTETGFIFPAGEASISYNGITVIDMVSNTEGWK